MSVTDITTVAVKPVEVHLHTLRFHKKSLTPALYRQIPTTLPFSAEWTLDADLLGWVNVPGRSDHAEWHLLFTRDQRLLSCHLPVGVESFEAYRQTRYAIHDYTKILRPLLWAFAVTHRLRHAPDEVVASATNPDYTIRVTAGGIDETMTLDTDDLFWSLPPVSDPSNASPTWKHNLQHRFVHYVWRPLAYNDAHANPTIFGMWCILAKCRISGRQFIRMSLLRWQVFLDGRCACLFMKSGMTPTVDRMTLPTMVAKMKFLH